MKPTIPLLLGAALLAAACSGGSGGGLGGEVVSAAFAGANGPLVGTVIASSGSPNARAAGFDFAQITEREPYGPFTEGVIVVDGRRMDVLAYEDATRTVRWVELSDDRSVLVFAGGAPLSGSVPNGPFTYRGLNIIGPLDGSDFDWGNFTLRVDFADGTGSLDGSTSAFINSRISGPISVDRNSGTLSSDRLTLTYRGTSNPARIDGTFHGNAARGVTGQYRGTGSTSGVTGAIVGTR